MPVARCFFSVVNIHECLERVRSLILVEAEGDVSVIRDYDLSLPELTADPDQLIQAILNITGNALQALRENPKQTQPPHIILRRVPNVNLPLVPCVTLSIAFRHY